MVGRENYCENWFGPWRSWIQATTCHTTLRRTPRCSLPSLYTYTTYQTGISKGPKHFFPLSSVLKWLCQHAAAPCDPGDSQKVTGKAENLRRTLGKGKRWTSQSRWTAMTHTSGLRTGHIMVVPDPAQPLPSTQICSPTLLSPGKKVLRSTLDHTVWATGIRTEEMQQWGCVLYFSISKNIRVSFW